MPSEQPRRSARNINRPSRTSIAEFAYPEDKPTTPFEHLVSRLDQESFPANSFASIDDALVYALFSSKRKPHPSRAFFEDDSPFNLSTEEALDISDIFNHVAKTSSDSSEVAIQATQLIKSSYPRLISNALAEKVAMHLLTRYHILHFRNESSVRMEKVQFHVGKAERISCGLKATCTIIPGTIILATCSSMSSDLVENKASVSVIESSTKQKGPVGPRLILGPFRFANHDCDPNCQIMSIQNSHAFTLCAIQNIEAGESLTVRYTADTSYFGAGVCGCATCNPLNPPIAKRRKIETLPRSGEEIGRKTRRGGKRSKRAIAALKRNNTAEGLCSPATFDADHVERSGVLDLDLSLCLKAVM